MEKNRTVLINQWNYNVKRNFADLPFQRYRITYRAEFYRLRNVLRRKLGFPVLEADKFSYQDFGWYSGDIVHLWNGIRRDRRPWVSTFEYTLPWWRNTPPEAIDRAVERVAAPYCKRLIAFSKAAAVTQQAFLETRYSALAPAILSKTTIVHPAQPTLLGGYEEKELEEGDLVFTMVGAQFYRKGGAEIVRAFDRLLSEGAPLRLNIIARIALEVGSRVTEEEHRATLARLEKHRERIACRGLLPNQETLSILKKTHVGLLPTQRDTFGYSVLEAQAMGCPVISTNVQSLPEINNDDIGWIIPVPKDDLGLLLTDEKSRRCFSSQVEEGIYQAVRDILNDPTLLPRKGARCLERIARAHAPEDKARVLEAIYDAALAD
jgi:glycosyltransferase involved in cell wall biosynthesis